MPNEIKKLRGRDQYRNRGTEDHGASGSSLRQMPDGTIILRPQYHRRLLWSFGIISLLYVIILACALAVPGLAWLGIFLIPLTGVWLGLFLGALFIPWILVSKLTPTDLLTRTWYGGFRKIPRTSIAHIVLCAIPGRSGKSRYLLFLDKQGHCIKRRTMADIPMGSVLIFVGQCGVPFRNASSHAKSVRELRKEFPGF